MASRDHTSTGVAIGAPTPSTPFTLDTSGRVEVHPPGSWIAPARAWADLTPFAQGFLEAAAKALYERLRLSAGGCTHEAAWAATTFRNWSPEALALILRDCSDCKDVPGCAPLSDTADTGKMFWEMRQTEGLPRWPALTPYLSDDGKVCLREPSQ